MTGRLPISVRPAHQETVTSYVRRLAELHALPYKDLWHHLSGPPRYGSTSARRRLLVSDRLAVATGRPVAALERAMPELRDPAPDWRALRHLPQRACPACAARHPGGPVVRFFAHHEFVCTHHGYWIGPPLPAMPDLQPRRLAGLGPEIVTAQRQHTRLLRRYEWQHVFNAFDVSTPVCVDQRFQEPADAPLRRRWQQRLDLLIPGHIRFNTSVFLAAFYPEIVGLAELFCSPAWRAVARQALHSEQHQLAITTQVSHVIGREPHPFRRPGYGFDRWLRAMADVPQRAGPAQTFPQTRRVTPDGVPTNCSSAEEVRARKADREYAKHGHVPSWALPHYADRPADHDMPIGYQPDPQHNDERVDLEELITALTDSAN